MLCAEVKIAKVDPSTLIFKPKDLKQATVESFLSVECHTSTSMSTFFFTIRNPQS